MTTNATETQETADSESNDRLDRIHTPQRDVVSMAETIDVSDTDPETKEDLQKIASEYEASFRKRAERILNKRED